MDLADPILLIESAVMLFGNAGDRGCGFERYKPEEAVHAMISR